LNRTCGGGLSELLAGFVGVDAVADGVPTKKKVNIKKTLP
jgi:hypothetical protein